MYNGKSMIGALAVMLLASSCNEQDSLSLCPNLSEVGKGNRLLEEARRCVRVMAARYSISGQTPADIATAAIDFCRARKIEPIFADVNSLVMRDKLLIAIERDMQKSAIRTVVEMRTAACFTKPDLFDGVNDPIDRP